jgi:hypothetical protein
MTKLTVSVLVLMLCLSVCSDGARAATPQGPQTLRTLGRTKEAAEVDERLASIRSLTMQTH